MGNFSRNTFKLTNILNQLVTNEHVPNARHYVSVRLQQGVPVVDADWNEMEDIRRMELEMVLARAIGNGVPSGSDGFRVRSSGTDNNFIIETGLLFVDGWLIYNGQSVDYVNQPHKNSPGITPALPVIQNASTAQHELVYVDSWEPEIDSHIDNNIVDPRIGIETCVRLERVWVVRMEKIDNAADPLDPATIPNRQPLHRYYPLATIDRPVGGQITDGMMTDLRRTHLTLEGITYPPLLINDPVRGQRLDSARLAGAFRGNLDATRDLLLRSPKTFIYSAHQPETWQAMTAFQDVRASATSFEQQAQTKLLHQVAALKAMNSFFQIQCDLVTLLTTFVNGDIAPQLTKDLVDLYVGHLEGTSNNDSASLQFALDAGDLLGAVMAQERLNEEMALQSDTLPEGSVSAFLVSITPTGPLKDRTQQLFYQLTIRIHSGLSSALGAEDIRAIVSPGTGWNLQFQNSTQTDKKEIVVNVKNQKKQDIVLNISAEVGAANTSLILTVRPERRQQLVYTLPSVTMALGQELIPSDILASFTYEGPAIPPTISRDVMFSGVSLPFKVTNLSTSAEQYKIMIKPLSTSTGWQTPDEPVLAILAPDADRNIAITFKTSDLDTAISQLTYLLQLVRITDGADEALSYTAYEIKFTLI